MLHTRITRLIALYVCDGHSIPLWITHQSGLLVRGPEGLSAANQLMHLSSSAAKPAKMSFDISTPQSSQKLFPTATFNEELRCVFIRVQCQLLKCFGLIALSLAMMADARIECQATRRLLHFAVEFILQAAQYAF